jgi:hypothetical protein
MIRPLSLLTGIAMAAAIGHTFEVKRSVTVLDRELRDIRRGTEEVEGRTQLLQAEWARLNDQERLRGLADRHLAGLLPMQSGQFQRLDEAVRRLPVAVAWNGPASPFAPRDETTAALAQAWLAPAPAMPAAATAAAAPAAAPAAPPAALAPAAQPPGTASGTASLAATSRPGAAPAPASNASAAAGLAAAAQPAAPRANAPAAPASSPARAAEPAAQRPSQLADAAAPRATRPTAVIPEAPSRAAQSLPPVAAPPTRPAEAPARSAAPPTILAEARRNIPTTRSEASAALPPVSTAYRPAVHVQRVDTGSMLGGQPNGIAPPVPYIR